MSDKIEQIPEKTRWEMATKGLTGAYSAISNAFSKAAGQAKFEDFNGSFWHEAGKGAKPFAASLGLPTQTAPQIEEATHLLAKASMGPEFVFEVAEANNDRCVGTTTQCPWHKRWKELGLGSDICSVGHQRWGDAAVESLNPNFTFKLKKNMVRGDAHCEWVVERKN
ncbi:MAG TPA: L-2-amino-thiazoline-4-carboxylic acid hydrolase [Terriglobia bacterium]|nr:L-2-amino-thiazoline-4-carboxylic acid hydrolase [Terriglobia bacterium]